MTGAKAGRQRRRRGFGLRSLARAAAGQGTLLRSTGLDRGKAELAAACASGAPLTAFVHPAQPEVVQYTAGGHRITVEAFDSDGEPVIDDAVGDEIRATADYFQRLFIPPRAPTSPRPKSPSRHRSMAPHHLPARPMDHDGPRYR